MNDILILGGGYGGVLAAIRAARLLRGTGCRIRLVDRGDGLVERIRLHEVAAGRPLRAHTYAQLLRGTGVEHVRGDVVAIGRGESQVVLSSRERLPFDRIIYALGSDTHRPPVAGIERAFSIGSASGALATADAVRALARRGAAGGARPRVAIVGGGLTGIEAATAIAEAYPSLHLTLFDAAGVGADLAPRGRRHLHAVLAARGIETREQTSVMSVDAIDADLVIWCASVAPSPLAAGTGLAVDRCGRVLVDDHLRSSDPRIVAIGDSAAVSFGATKLTMSCATAQPMGAYAGEEVAADVRGRAHAPFDFGYAITCIALGRRDGLVQFRNADNTARDAVLTGRSAAVVKELICRYTIASLRFERAGVPYRWPGGLLPHTQAMETHTA
jgi:NADH dehydrogenase FAD-containing subunit